MKTNKLKLMRRHRRLYRFIGVMFVLVGGMLCITIVPLVFDPSSTINYNGEATTAMGAKLSALGFTLSFVVVGLGFTFAPSELLNKLFVWRQSALSALAFWRK